jgi:polysaccharide pyruvyl transferase WcaK-like protein
MPMRFLVESGTYAVDNLGDIAMLQRTVWKLRERFPDASVGVVTEQPERLRRVLPEVEPVVATPWFRLRVVPVPRRWEWTPMVRRIRWREKLLAGRMPRLARVGKRADYWASAAERAAGDRFYQTVRAADAVIAAGGGYINDFYHEHAWKVLATLNLAQGLGKLTAMFSIGLGPISRHDLLWHGGAVMRRLSLLALRESQLGPAEAARLGVPNQAIVSTGDDAVAVAASATLPDRQRDSVGVNLRLAADADVPDHVLPQVRMAVTRFTRHRRAPLVPLIVRTAQSPANDVYAVGRIFGDDIDLTRAKELFSPQEALAEMARCRVIVTGAYHNAVFALSMGIPVVALARTPYYMAKLRGVEREFQSGMTILSLDDPNLAQSLACTLERLWENARALEAPLRAAAAQQAARGDAAYARFFAMLARRQSGGLP